MRGYTLFVVYGELRRIGAVRSQRDFAARYLRRGKTYLRDLGARDRMSSWLSADTADGLSDRLTDLRNGLPAPLRDDVSVLIEMIARDRYVAKFLA